MPDDAVSIRSVLLDGARRWGIENPLATAKVFGDWQEMVGEQVAARCQPVSLGRGVLRVLAANPAWAGELRYLAPEVIRRVNKAVGAEVVKELKVAIKPLAGSGPGSAPGSASGSRARSAAGARGGWAGGAGGARAGAGPPVRKPDKEPPTALLAGTPADQAAADAVVSVIADERLAAATKRALLAAKTHRRIPGGRG